MKNVDTRRIVNLVSFCALIFIAISLLIAQVFNSGIMADIGGILRQISTALAYIVVAIYAFFFVRYKKKIGWMITYIVSTILVGALIIVPVVL